MKNLLLFLGLFSLNFVFAQQKDQIVEVRTDERIFRGQINEKYAITIYLKYFQSSGEHRGIYSVKGWYYYDNVEKKIPLVGLSENSDLTLFAFQQKEKQDSILEFKYGDFNFWEGLERLKNITGFDEKFVYNTEQKIWLTPAKTHSLHLYSDDVSIEKHIQYIQTMTVNKSKFIDLNEMCDYLSNFQLVHSVHSASENSFLLKYEFASNPYIQGRCGAGTEDGYAVLKYDGNYTFVSFQNVLLNSCYDGLTSESLASRNPNLLMFKVEDFSGEKAMKVSIDLTKNSITVN